MNCEQTIDHIDAYLDDELLVETNLSVIAHLESCQTCSATADAERRLRVRLQKAVRYSDQTDIDLPFQRNLTESLRPRNSQSNWLAPILAVWSARGAHLAVAALALVVLSGAYFVYRLPRVTEQAGLSDKTLASWLSLTAEAVGDHINCSFGSHTGEKPISLAEAAREVGAYNADLDKSVMQALTKEFPDDIKFVDGHSCLYNGRRFTHLEFQRSGELVSVIVTDADLGGLNSSVTDLGITKGYDTWAFQAGRQAVFIISALGSADNGQFARAVAPAVRRHIESAKG